MKLFVTINNFCSIGKVIACLIVILGGIQQLYQGNVENLSSGFDGTTTKPGHIALAFFNGLWAYDGWVSVTLVTEEVKSPEKCVPTSDCDRAFAWMQRFSRDFFVRFFVVAYFAATF